MQNEHISLSVLNSAIQDLMYGNFSENIWIIAEIGDIKYNKNGHAYLELIEKSEENDKIIAKASANIWSYTLRMLKPYFETTTGQSLQAGLKILVAVKVEFHQLYGFSLNIRDIDPTYTLGDLERRRLEIIEQLKTEGVFDMNKMLEMPKVVQKIAIISSATAAGYEDFMKQLNNNSYGYQFHTQLFPAIMQGDKTEATIIEALNEIFEYDDFFDAVVIIRGGGARSDLMSFDSYDLAYFITQFPLPVIVGIGHEKDTSIVDLVSHSSLKTPTAVAEFLLSKFIEFEQGIINLFSNIYSHTANIISNNAYMLENLNLQLTQQAKERLNTANNKLQLISQKIQLKSSAKIDKSKQYLNYKRHELNTQTVNFTKGKNKELEDLIVKLEYRLNQHLQKQNKKLAFFEKSIQHLDPKNILKKGYSISKINGKIIRNAENIEKGDILETILYDGNVKSKVF